MNKQNELRTASVSLLAKSVNGLSVADIDSFRKIVAAATDDEAATDRWFQRLIVVGLMSMLFAILCIYLGIWLCDGRWALTAIPMFLLCLLMIAVGYVGSRLWEK